MALRSDDLTRKGEDGGCSIRSVVDRFSSTRRARNGPQREVANLQPLRSFALPRRYTARAVRPAAILQWVWLVGQPVVSTEYDNDPPEESAIVESVDAAAFSGGCLAFSGASCRPAAYC